MIVTLRLGQMLGNLEGVKYGGTKPLKEDSTLEAPSTFAKRTVDWWNREVVDWCRSRAALVTNDYKGLKDIIAVTHGGFILVLMEMLLGSRKVKLDDGVEVGQSANTSVTEIDVLANGKGIVRSFGRTDHLDGQTDALGSNADVDGSGST